MDRVVPYAPETPAAAYGADVVGAVGVNDALEQLRLVPEDDVVQAIVLAAEAIVAAIDELREEVRELRRDLSQP